MTLQSRHCGLKGGAGLGHRCGLAPRTDGIEAAVICKVSPHGRSCASRADRGEEQIVRARQHNARERRGWCTGAEVWLPGEPRKSAWSACQTFGPSATGVAVWGVSFEAVLEPPEGARTRKSRTTKAFGQCVTILGPHWALRPRDARQGATILLCRKGLCGQPLQRPEKGQGLSQLHHPLVAQEPTRLQRPEKGQGLSQFHHPLVAQEPARLQRTERG